METLKSINYIIAVLFFICYFYQFAYILVPFFMRGKPHKSAVMHTFAVLICARNEENVISDLITSIRSQSYDPSLISIFVLADNCTDSTAMISRKAGAIVYERTNKTGIGKGYALDHLLKKIKTDYPDKFDGYFVIDADNILDPNFITEMNRTFSDGYNIVTSYRNSKNYGSNWISAGYSLWFLRESRYLNNARHLLGTSCAVSGTGFLFGRNILDHTGGWPFHLLTEDIEFSVYNILHGEKIGFCPDAVIYDEQPVAFGQSCTQRLRWAKGYLQVFRKHGTALVKGIFKGCFSCFDMSMSIMPAIILTAVSIISNISLAAAGIVNGDSLLTGFMSIMQFFLNMYLMLLVIGGITTATEWKNIRTGTAKKIIYAFTFPLFMFTYIPISFYAMFSKSEWKPITHRISAAEFFSGTNIN